jgi:hypothetical protein
LDLPLALSSSRLCQSYTGALFCTTYATLSILRSQQAALSALMSIYSWSFGLFADALHQVL